MRGAEPDNVFINCPFDMEFKPLMDAMVFTIQCCGFKPKCALEESDSGEVRIEKIVGLIKKCNYGIHDLSRVELDSKNKLPRFNMPLELGLFFGAKKFGAKEQKNKKCMITDCEQHRYQKFLSDFAGQDVMAHSNEPSKMIAIISSWLRTASRKTDIPGGKYIEKLYATFKADLPEMANRAKLSFEDDEIKFCDYVNFVELWLVKVKSKQLIFGGDWTCKISNTKG